ncbi:hypothetical protein F5888DRAFT_1811328 [Russula emetica]|nr:hypothetical protein F5888DRAFT_1811328 [Russula emetica]
MSMKASETVIIASTKLDEKPDLWSGSAQPSNLGPNFGQVRKSSGSNFGSEPNCGNPTPNPLSELEPQNTGSQQADPLNGPVDVIATLDLLYFFTGIEQPTQGGPIILKQGPPPPKVCKLCSEKYGFDKSMLPGVARYIYGPTTANTNL